MNWTHIILHHTGAEEKDTEQIRQYHLSKGWQDIGYNYVIERDGKVVAGRSLSIPGAHCKAGQMNYKGIGVTLIGNFENHLPLTKQLEALDLLLLQLMQKHQIPATNVLGHREVSGAQTVCPGKHFSLDLVRAALINHPDPENNPHTSGTVTPTLWRVQVGAFSNRENAENLVNVLRGKGIDAIVTKA